MQSLDNIKSGNKELIVAQNSQSRGYMIGTMFIILGLFLILYDYSI
jgi:hypothetical protein